jgi:hypothetical protein
MWSGCDSSDNPTVTEDPSAGSLNGQVEGVQIKPAPSLEILDMKKKMC